MSGWFKNMGRGSCCDCGTSVCCDTCINCASIRVAISDVDFGTWANGLWTLTKYKPDDGNIFKYYRYIISEQMATEGEKAVYIVMECHESHVQGYYISLMAREIFYEKDEEGNWELDESGERIYRWEQNPFVGAGGFDHRMLNLQDWGGVATATCSNDTE